jgi:hypothetical protein
VKVSCLFVSHIYLLINDHFNGHAIIVIMVTWFIYTNLTFHPGLSRKISNIMANHDIQLVPKASEKHFQVLGSPKDVVDERAKSGICDIQCQTCPAVYYGQTRRSIDERFKEHMSMVRTRAEEKSSVAKHNPSHVITPEDLSPSTTCRCLGEHNHSQE